MIGRAERGSASMFVAVVVAALFLGIGLVVDGGGRLRAIDRAQHAAEQAARAAGQQIEASTAITGQAPGADAARAVAAAQATLAGAGVTGTVQVSGSRVRVSAQETYEPVFLAVIGISAVTVTGSAEARIARGISGETP